MEENIPAEQEPEEMPDPEVIVDVESQENASDCFPDPSDDWSGTLIVPPCLKACDTHRLHPIVSLCVRIGQENFSRRKMWDVRPANLI